MIGEQMDAGAETKRHASSRWTSNMRRVRQSAIAILAEKGHRDRKSGGWSMPVDDAAEPGRTERLLASPFAIQRRRAGDSLHALEGCLMFRVNGTYAGVFVCTMNAVALSVRPTVTRNRAVQVQIALAPTIGCSSWSSIYCLE
jgi:hypothetical protein